MNCNDHQFLGLDAATRMALTRRTFLSRSAAGLGLAALGSLMNENLFAASATKAAKTGGALEGYPHFPIKARRVIYLFQSGAPSQMDLFDPKPQLASKRGEDLPDSIRKGQRLTTMTSGQKTFPVAPSLFKFAQHGKSGAWLSELMPHLA